MTGQEFTTEELKSEEWRDVVGLEGYYAISNLGRVKNIATGKKRRAGHVLKPSLNGGYPQVMMSRDYHCTTRKIHVLVAAAFLGPCPLGSEPNHIDRNRANNRVGNLEYLTHRENVQHSIDNFTAAKPRGERQHLAKLTEAKVRHIRHLVALGFTYREIQSKFYAVDITTLHSAATRKTWKHVE